MELAKNIYAFALHVLGFYFVFNGVMTLYHGGGIEAAAGITNGLLSIVAGLLFIVSGELIWILSALKSRATDRLERSS